MIVTLFCGTLPGKLRKRFPDQKILAFNGTRGDLAAIRKADDGSPLDLLGYSAGCHGVRDLLVAGLRPRGVYTFDGTHASMPGRPPTMPIQPWKDLFARARAGECFWLASHVYNTYTEKLPAPYYSTVTVLRDVTGALLPEPPPGKSPIYTRLPGVLLASYDSKEADTPAHGRQISEEAERLYTSFSSHNPGPVVPDVFPALGAALAGVLRVVWPWTRRASLGLEMLAVATSYLGLKEDAGRPNAGPEIDRWLAAVGAGSPNNWCAASIAQWLRVAAASLGVKPPIAGSGGAKATRDQFQAAARWASAADVRAGKVELRPGMVPVWHRGLPGAWTGHIGVLETVPVDGVHFGTIEGNSGNTGTEVARMTRRLDDVNLLGFGWVD